MNSYAKSYDKLIYFKEYMLCTVRQTFSLTTKNSLSGQSYEQLARKCAETQK